SEDAAVAETALHELEATPARTVRYLRARLHPVPPPDPTRLARLVADLDSPLFATREHASRQLEQLGDVAGPAVRKAARSRSPEVRRRALILRSRLDRATSNGAEARPLRAIEVLENLGTPDARAALAHLAGGTPEARLTQEATAAL